MLKLFLLVWLLIIIIMLGVWLFYRILNNPTVVDVGWTAGLVISGFIYLFANAFNARLCLIAALLLIWGLRLGGFLFQTRLRKGVVDKRYVELSANWKIAKSLGFFLNFQLQGVFVMLVSLPFLWIGSDASAQLNWLDAIAVILILFAILAESVADYQLYAFQQSKNPGVCNKGLWQYSRHPNYFFEWCVWLGFSLFALNSWPGLFALISPLTLYLIMTKITGPITEKGSLASRGDAYVAYQRNTPMFFPNFFRKK